MKRTLSVVLIAVVLACVGCKGSRTMCYQVYNVTPTSHATTIGTKMVMEHDSLRCWYDLWSNGGNSGVELENFSDQTIVLLNPISFFTLNGHRYPFYDRVQAAELDSMTRVAKERGSDSVYSPDHPFVTVLPPHSSIYVDGFTVNSLYFSDDKLNARPKKAPRSKKDKTPSMSFDRDDSPLMFSNTLTYLMGADTIRQHITDEFYVSQVTNMTQEDLYVPVHPTRDDGTVNEEEWMYLCPSATPDCFYVQYDPDDTPGNYSTEGVLYMAALFVAVVIILLAQGE